MPQIILHVNCIFLLDRMTTYQERESWENRTDSCPSLTYPRLGFVNQLTATAIRVTLNHFLFAKYFPLRQTQTKGERKLPFPFEDRLQTRFFKFCTARRITEPPKPCKNPSSATKVYYGFFFSFFIARTVYRCSYNKQVFVNNFFSVTVFCTTHPPPPLSPSRGVTSASSMRIRIQ